GFFVATNVYYNTGEEATGYYYIYASDTKDYTGSDTKGITVDHKAVSGKLDEPYDDETLNYWLIIANSPNREYDAYASSNVYGNGNVVPGVISVTAYSATKNGYYLYVNSTDPKATDINQSTIGTDTKVYASTQTTRTDANDNLLVAGNIMIFYKEYQSTTTLEYNGFYRNAPANDELGWQREMVSVSEPEEGENYFNGHYYYTFFGTDRANGINEAKEVGIHNVKTEIWTYDSNGQILVLGKVDTTDSDLTEDQLKKYKWEITPRQLSVKYSTPTEHRQVDGIKDAEVLKQYTGKFSHFITVTISGMALDEDIDKITNFASGTDVAKLFTIAYPKYGDKNLTPTYDDRASNSDFYGEGTVVVAYCDGAGAEGSIDTTNTLDSEGGQSLAEATYYTITYYVFAKDAGTYNITVGTDKNHEASSTSGKIEVEKRKIKLDITTSDDTTLQSEYTFDGGVEYRGVQSITFTGIVQGDLTSGLNAIISAGMVHDRSDYDNYQTRQTVYSEYVGNNKIEFRSSDVGTYTAKINLTENFVNNYAFVCDSLQGAWADTINASWSASWSIEQYEGFDLSSYEVKVDDTTYVYDGKKHIIDYKIVGAEYEMENGVIGPIPYGGEIITIRVNAYGKGYAEAVNAGSHPIDKLAVNFTGTVERSDSLAKSEDPNVNYVIEFPTSDNGVATLTIEARKVKIEWVSSEFDKNRIYNGQEQGIDVSNAVKVSINTKQYERDEKGNQIVVNENSW
ncbi:MAG: hypothetical protein J6V37_01195, partial [Clostridia bacterium]|nr:hypothetical protein [Clostridia bacterium]